MPPPKAQHKAQADGGRPSKPCDRKAVVAAEGQPIHPMNGPLELPGRTIRACVERPAAAMLGVEQTIMNEFKSRPLLIGIEIGGTKLQFVVGEGSGRILSRRKIAAAAEGGAPAIRAQIQHVLLDMLPGQPIAGIGVGFGGPVDRSTGGICCSHQVQGWSGFGLGAWLRQLSSLPVTVENDSNLAALAEATLGAGQGADPCFYFNLGSGVGGGLVAGGRIYWGAPPGEAEFGHLRLDRQGATVESRCSGWAVDKRIRAAAAAEPESPLARLAGEDRSGESRHLAHALTNGDSSAWRILRETAEDLGFALSHAVHLFHPAVIVMGGGLSLVGEPLRAAVDAALRQHLMEAFQPGPALRLARLAEDAVPAGALLLAGQSGVQGAEEQI